MFLNESRGIAQSFDGSSLSSLMILGPGERTESAGSFVKLL